jgi:hypothetical protein
VTAAPATASGASNRASSASRALGADPESLLPNGRWPGDVFDWLIELRYDENGDLFESKRIDEHLSSEDSIDMLRLHIGKGL